MSARAKEVDPTAVHDAMKRLGRRIAGARAERGMSQAQVAEVAGTTHPRISQIENATASTRLDTIVRVATAVGLELTLRDSAA